MKLINNFMSQGMAALVAEAVNTATKAGVDLELLEVVAGAGGANSGDVPAHDAVGARRGRGRHGLQAQERAEDVRYYTRLAEAVGSTAFLGAAVHQVFTLAAAQGEARATSRRSPRARQGQRGQDRAAGLRLPPRARCWARERPAPSRAGSDQASSRGLTTFKRLNRAKSRSVVRNSLTP